jgi:hypothetical protein
MAKLFVRNAGSTRVLVRCTLVNDLNADEDTSRVTVEPKGTTEFLGRSMVMLEAGSTLSSSGNWTVRCNSSAKLVFAEDLKIQAIQVASESNTSA